MHWFSLALTCAISLALADVATKHWLSNYRARELVLIRFSLPGLLLSPMLLLQPFPALPIEFWYWIAILIPLEIIALLLYMQAIRDFPLWLTLPYLAFTPVFVTFTGWLLLGEQVTPLGFGGIFLVFLGAWMLNLKQAQQNGHHAIWEPFAAILRNRGSRLMLLVAIIYSITSVGGKGAMQYMKPDLFGPFYFTLIGTVALVLFTSQRPVIFHVLYRRPTQNLIVALFMCAMIVTHFLALQQVEAAYMIAVKRSSLLFGIILGAILFQERGLGSHLLAGSLMVSGVGLISLSGQSM